jgi:hypothetical protein
LCCSLEFANGFKASRRRDDDIAIVKNPPKKSEYSQENIKKEGNKKETDIFFNKIAEI